MAKSIGIAIVETGARYLVGIRGPDGPLPGYAEFPGGKCEPGEDPGDCAVRECREETGLAVRVERLLRRERFVYPHGEVDLHFFLCTPIDHRAVLPDHQGYTWRAREELSQLKFPEANRPVIEFLCRDC
ncbi:MAG: NUDIX domain-containing protein [Planctomycetaceae bacterium]